LDDPGPAELFFPGAIRTRIVDVAFFVQLCDGKPGPLVGIVEPFQAEASQTVIRICTFCGERLVDRWSHKIDSAVTAFALTEEAYVFCSSNYYILFKFSSETRVRLNASPISSPYSVGVTVNSFVLAYKDFLLHSGTLNEKGTILVYDQSLGLPQWMLPVPDAVYLFFQNNFIRYAIGTCVSPTLFEVPGVRCATMAEDTLLICTPTAVKIVGSIPPADEMARMITVEGPGEFDTIVSRMGRDAGAEATLSVFCELWKLDRPDLGLLLLTKHLIIGNIAAIVGLVPFIPLYVTPNPSLSLTPRPSNERRYVPALTAALQFQRGEYVKESAEVFTQELPIIDTAYAQCLSVECTDLGHTRELDRVLKAKNVNLPHFEAFLNSDVIGKLPESRPALAVFFANTERVDRAMNIWQKLDEATITERNPLFVTEAAYAVQMLRDPNHLHDYLNWIFDRDPVRPQTAITALLSINHQSALVETWLAKKNIARSENVLRYHCFIMQHANKTRSAQHASETLIQLLDVLAEIDDPGFELERLSFTEAYHTRSDRETDPVSFKDSAKAEITELTLHILRTNPENITAQEALEHVRDGTDRRIPLGILSAKRQYDEAINFLVPSLAHPRFDEVGEFCRATDDPPAAFAAFFKAIDKTLLLQNIRFLEDNLPWINVVSLVKDIPDGALIRKLEPLLKSAFNLMLQRKQNLDAQIALSQSLLLEARFRSAELQMGYRTIKMGSKCAVCQGTINENAACLFAPGDNEGPIYHHHCKPAQKK
jgi:hypothetical protein